MKKVLIMTLEQGSNYGGMLQAYALQKKISDLGLDVESSFVPKSLHKRLVKSLPGVKWTLNTLAHRKSVDSKIVTKHTKKFIDNYIKLVDFRMVKKKTRLNLYDAYVVGSDQVWRKPYTKVPQNLFSFVKNDALKISYAASFGRDDLEEYGRELIVETKYLAKKMTAVSVREDSGVGVASKYWGVEAIQHVDPTLLVNGEEYSNLIDVSESVSIPKGSLFSYVLDPAEDKQSIATIVANSCDFKVFTVVDGDENNGQPMPPVEQWLRSFRDAEYVVTDSFHGTVFAIIFNKPFIAVGNRERGIARFASLLRIFGLEDRLVTSLDEVTEELIHKTIDWVDVNAKVKFEQKRSLDYLKNYLR